MRIYSILLCWLLSASLIAGPAFNRLIVFGDSLSDNGNLYEYMRHQVPQSPPYFEGRFSNGPAWVELLSEKYAPEKVSDFLLDYAFGGAGVYEGEDDDGMFTLKNEISMYLSAHNNAADPDSLYVIWIGANNYLAIPEDTDAAVSEVTEGIRHGIQRLIDSGAKQFLVLNIPDLGTTPIASEFGEVEKMHRYSSQHNQRLLQVIDELRQSYADLNWYFYDVEQMLNKAIENPENYGLTNIKDTCYEAMVDKGSQQTVLHMARTLLSDGDQSACDGYLFFDPVHPTETAHTILADEIYKLLESSTDRLG